MELSNEISIDLLLDDNHETHDWYPFEKDGVQLEADSFTPDNLDQYLSAQILVPIAGDFGKRQGDCQKTRSQW